MPTVTEPTLWERLAGAACRPLHGYRRHEPEKTLLHAVVREQRETFLAEARERTSHGLPAFVERELRGYTYRMSWSSVVSIGRDSLTPSPGPIFCAGA